MVSLKLSWSIRAMRFKDRVRNNEEGSLLWSWKEKKSKGWEDRYSRERERYYNRIGWELEELETLRRSGENLEDQVILREHRKMARLVWQDTIKDIKK